MLYMVKRTNRKQSAEIEWSSVDSNTDDRNTAEVRRTKHKTTSKEQNDDDVHEMQNTSNGNY